MNFLLPKKQRPIEIFGFIAFLFFLVSPYAMTMSSETENKSPISNISVEMFQKQSLDSDESRIPYIPDSAAIGDTPSLNREMFPIVLNMGSVGSVYSVLQGLTEEHIRIAYYSENYQWALVPFQIDQIGSAQIWQDSAEPPNDPNPQLVTITTYISDGSGQLDNNDELVFYAFNGLQVSNYLWYDSLHFPNRIELEIQDPYDGGKSWMYIYYNPTSPQGAISSEPWYQDFVSWNKFTFQVDSPVYQLGFQANNYDIISSVKIKNTNENNLITQFKKRFIWSDLSDSEFGTGNEGFWPSGDGFSNPGNYNLMKSAVDDPSDAYDSNEGNLRYAPSTSNDISGAGDHNAVIDGPVRVILGFPHFEYTDCGTIFFIPVELHIQSHSISVFYFNMMEEQTAKTDLEAPPVGSMTVWYSFNDILELNPSVRNEIRINYGATTQNPYYSSFTNGLRVLIPDGNPNNDGYSHGGDPTTKLGLSLPNNPQFPDWMMLTSNSNGGLWRYLARVETSVTNVNELNIYWHDGAIAETGFETEFARPIPSGGIHLASYWLRTVFGDYSNSDNIWQKGNQLHFQAQHPLDELISYSFQNLPVDKPILHFATPDALMYAGGQTITLDVNCDSASYLLSASFRNFDSDYSAGDVVIQNLGSGDYRITYEISSSNIKNNGRYLIPITIQGTTTTIDSTLYLSYFNTNILDLVSIESELSSITPGDIGIINLKIDNEGNGPILLNEVELEMSQSDQDYSSDYRILSTVPALPYILPLDATVPTEIELEVEVLGDAHPGDIIIDFGVIAEDVGTGFEIHKIGADATGSWFVDDIFAPELIENVEDLYIIRGTENNVISWVWTDFAPKNYSISRTDLSGVNQTGLWDNSNPIMFNVDGLNEGMYEFLIEVMDEYGNSANDCVNVSVQDVEVLISRPLDKEFRAGTQDQIIHWIGQINDTHDEDSFVILQNGIEISSGPWIAGDPIIWDVSALSYGIYTFFCEINTTDGFVSNDTLIVSVLNDIPEIIELVENITMIEGDFGIYQWYINDQAQNGGSYTVLVDGIQKVNSGIWGPYSTISFTIQDIGAGLHNITLEVRDGLGGTDLSVGSIIVLPNMAPKTISPFDMEYLVGSTGYYLVWMIEDNTTKDAEFEIYRDSGLVMREMWQSGDMANISLDSLSLGVHIFNIIIEDGYGAVVEDEVIVTVNKYVADRSNTYSTLKWVGGGIGIGLVSIIGIKYIKNRQLRMYSAKLK